MFSTLHTSLLLLVLLSLEVYCVILAGFFRGSKYSAMGGVRRALLGIRREIATALLVFMLQITVGGGLLIKRGSPLLWFLIPFWFLFLLVDTATRPFDLTESESELVSGFNTEYGRAFFMLLFLREYIKIILLSYLTAFLFFSGSLYVFIGFIVLLLISQCTFLRYKPDQLISIIWRVYLPLVLFMFMFLLYI